MKLVWSLQPFLTVTRWDLRHLCAFKREGLLTFPSETNSDTERCGRSSSSRFLDHWFPPQNSSLRLLRSALSSRGRGGDGPTADPTLFVSWTHFVPQSGPTGNFEGKIFHPSTTREQFLGVALHSSHSCPKTLTGLQQKWQKCKVTYSINMLGIYFMWFELPVKVL